jgi:hypothetical protein
MMSWIRNLLNRYSVRTTEETTDSYRNVGFIEEKPNVWRVVYVDNKKN